MKRLSILLLASVATSALLTGCSSTQKSAAPGAPTTTAPAAQSAGANPAAGATTGSGATGGTTTGGAATGPKTAGPGTTGPNTASPNTAGPSTAAPATGAQGGTAASSTRCHSADLSVKIGTGGGAAGTLFENLVFTNKTNHACTLFGYPGVSWVAGDKGTQVNDPFARSSATPKKTVKLAAGGQAHAILATHPIGLFDQAKCKPVAVRGLRIYPPDETAAIFVSQPGTACSAKGVNLGAVQAIAAGVGTAG